MSQLLDAIDEVARLGGETALSQFRANIAVETKQDGTVVTQADRQTEQVIRDWIEKHFPDDGIIGEEFGSVRTDAQRHWIIDPIDGTVSFVHGVPLWGTLIALAEGETILAGAINCAATNELLVAERGMGSWYNGARCSVSTVNTVGEATVLTANENFGELVARQSGWQRLAERARVRRTWGDCYGYLLVATGRAEVMTDPVMNDWDSAAPSIVIEEAGGVFTDWDGRQTPFGKCSIGTNAALAQEARALLV